MGCSIYFGRSLLLIWVQMEEGAERRGEEGGEGERLSQHLHIFQPNIYTYVDNERGREKRLLNDGDHYDLSGIIIIFFFARFSASLRVSISIDRQAML